MSTTYKLPNGREIALDAEEMHALRAALMEQEDLDYIRGRARELVLPLEQAKFHGDFHSAAEQIVNLAETAHADGYRLCVKDLESARDVIREQAQRYMAAVYSPEWVFRALETFDNHLVQWIWAVASSAEGTVGEECIAWIEDQLRQMKRRPE
jgi:hypothetical protein